MSERDYEAVSRTISSLKEMPRPAKVKKLADSGLWRVRVGKYRIVYSIEDDSQTVTILRVARRKEGTCKGLK